MFLAPERLGRADVIAAHVPFDFLIAHAQLDDGARTALVDAFPRYRSAGFFPYRAGDCGAPVRELVEELASPEFAAALGTHLGKPDLAGFSTIVTLSDSVHRRHGTIHTDSASKVATALLYLNPDWPDTSAGCLRFLTCGDDIDALAAPEIRPLYGTLAAFARAGNSWHGHLPYDGPRRVIQVAWLTSAEEAERKQRRGRLSRLVKRLAGKLDRRWGEGRDVSARHG